MHPAVRTGKTVSLFAQQTKEIGGTKSFVLIAGMHVSFRCDDIAGTAPEPLRGNCRHLSVAALTAANQSIGPLDHR
jgi:hypothetical protein